MISRIADAALTLAFPQTCQVCREKVLRSRFGIACETCWRSTRFFTGEDVLCAKCGLPLDAVKRNGDVRCRECVGHAYDRAAACGVYENALSATVLNLKKVPVMPRVVKEAITASLTRSAIHADIVIPVPLAPKRRVERGYNQAEVIAKVLAKEIGIKIDSQSLSRHRHTPMHRAGMDRKAREATVKSAFEVVRPKLIEGRSILLVDDVLTSGATASACAEVLKKNGAGEVNLFTLARAVTIH